MDENEVVVRKRLAELEEENAKLKAEVEELRAKIEPSAIAKQRRSGGGPG